MNENKGIWLYFNNKGSLVSKIPHGQVVRQGGAFTLFFAFENEKYMEGKSLTVGFQKPGELSPSVYLPVSNIKKIKFEKYKPNEITYGLIDGRVYNVYEMVVPAAYGYTEKYGMLNVVSKIYKQVGEKDGIDILPPIGQPDNTEVDDIIYFQGSVQLYVEPTYGKANDTSNITASEAEILANEIGKKLDKVDGTATNLTIESGKISKEVKVGDLPGNVVIGSKEVEQEYVKINNGNANGLELNESHIKNSEIDRNTYVGDNPENKLVGNLDYDKKTDEKLKKYVYADGTQDPDAPDTIYLTVDEADSAHKYIDNKGIKKSIYDEFVRLNDLIANVENPLSIKKVDQLPMPPEPISKNTIYLVPSSKEASQNVFDEFIYLDNSWEQVGSTSVDLSQYSTTAEIEEMLKNYDTISVADEKYAKKGELANYVTTENANSTYAAKSDLNSYVTTENANSTYATKNVVNSSTNGLMASADKTKLDKITEKITITVENGILTVKSEVL